MTYVPIDWTFEKKSGGLFPVMEARGESPSRECEQTMLQDVLEVVCLAREFKGIPYPKIPQHCKLEGDIEITVSFSILFPTEGDIDSFMDAI